MELRTVDPRKLKANPNNPRRTGAGEFFDAQLTASIKAVGLIQPPLVLQDGKKLVIVAGHRRVAAAVAAGLAEIPVLVQSEADAAIDPMRSISENVIRAEMGQVDRWRAIEALTAAGWNEAAIAEALGLTPRNIAQARLLANICPAMLDQMAKNDLPAQRQLRIIAAASKEEQVEVWKQHKPKRGHEADWHSISNALSRVRLPASEAKFSAAEAEAFGIVWDEDLFAPANEDSRTTTQVDAYLAAQTAWLEANMAEGDCIAGLDDYGRPVLPKGAERYYGQQEEGVSTAYYLDARTGKVHEARFVTLSRGTEGKDSADGDATPPTPTPRPDVTAKGAAIVGDLRTEALHQALRERPMDDDQLIAMLVLALGSRNVTVQSGIIGRFRSSSLPRLAETLTEGGVLTRDLATIRQVARDALVEVLSCRDNPSASGMSARYAGAAIDAEAYLPNMATEEFLPALSRAALERNAEALGIAKQVRVKDTRAAVIAHFAEGTFVYPGARFAPTQAELEARRNPASLIGGCDTEGEVAGEFAGDGAEDSEGLNEPSSPDDDTHTALAATTPPVLDGVGDMQAAA